MVGRQLSAHVLAGVDTTGHEILFLNLDSRYFSLGPAFTAIVVLRSRSEVLELPNFQIWSNVDVEDGLWRLELLTCSERLLLKDLVLRVSGVEGVA